MKHLKIFKIFEANFKRTPVKNDWIITNINNLAKIFQILDSFGKKAYRIRYYTRLSQDDVDMVSSSNIKHFGTKEEMEAILTSNKYNL